MPKQLPLDIRKDRNKLRVQTISGIQVLAGLVGLVTRVMYGDPWNDIPTFVLICVLTIGLGVAFYFFFEYEVWT